MNRLGPWLVIRGLIFGSFVVIFFTGALATRATSIESKPVSVSDPLSATQDLEEQVASVDTSVCRVSSRYPEKVRRWCDIIQKYADKNGLPPDLVAALVWQESGGNPKAYSRSGAVGLMQIMASDGLSASFMCVNGPCFAKRPTMEQLKDPEFNVKYGTRMLAGLNNRLGSIREALKSYGPMNVGYYYADKVLGIYESYRE